MLWIPGHIPYDHSHLRPTSNSLAHPANLIHVAHL